LSEHNGFAFVVFPVFIGVAIHIQQFAIVVGNTDSNEVIRDFQGSGNHIADIGEFEVVLLFIRDLELDCGDMVLLLI
jgi:hypothetical protein